MGDKIRYAITRFAGEENTAHCSDGTETTDHRVAYQHVSDAAQRIADSSQRGAAYIYDTTLSPGGQFTDEQAAQLVDAYRADLEARGVRVEGMTYVVHQNTRNTHVHLLYATQKTIQHGDNRGNKRVMAREADKLRTPEQAREWQAAQERAAERMAQRQAVRTTRSSQDDHDRGR